MSKAVVWGGAPGRLHHAYMGHAQAVENHDVPCRHNQLMQPGVLNLIGNVLRRKLGSGQAGLRRETP